jgi:hypothetical protein
MAERRFQRVPFHAKTRVTAEGTSWDCTLLNIALKGALLESSLLPVEPGATCDIRMTLPGTDIALEFRSLLVYHQGSHFGFKFLHVDLETLTHLRKLIELNTGDADGVRGELMAWLSED